MNPSKIQDPSKDLDEVSNKWKWEGKTKFESTFYSNQHPMEFSTDWSHRVLIAWRMTVKRVGFKFTKPNPAYQYALLCKSSLDEYLTEAIDDIIGKFE